MKRMKITVGILIVLTLAFWLAMFKGGGGGGGIINEGDYGRPGGAGGSCIVILRGTEDDMLPIIFNGTQIS